MKLSSIIWRCLLLAFSINYCPLLPAGCIHPVTSGYLTVEPAPLILMGSNCTVYCHITKCPQRSSSKIFLRLNGKPVDKYERINCTTVKFHLPGLWIPNSTVLCWLKSAQKTTFVSGLDLKAGLPPDKPDIITCETTRSAASISCSWSRGQDTYLHTDYNVFVKRENGSQVYQYQLDKITDKIIVPEVRDVNTKYVIIITARNHFGASQSDPFILCVKDIVMPESPHITKISSIYSVGSSIAAVLQWKTSESLEHLRPHVRLRTANTPWELREGVEVGESSIRVDNLTPLTEYEFQMKICHTASELTCTNTSLTDRNALLCSKWSPSVRSKTHGKAPSQQLHVWRKVDGQGINGQLNLTVLWKPLPCEDFSGKVERYEISLGQELKTCAADCNQCAVQVPAEVRSLSVSAVTSCGKSPPADVILGQSGVSGALLGELSPVANGSDVLISWSWPTNKWPLIQEEEELLNYVIEWTSVPTARLQWQMLSRDLKHTSITGLTPGVRYNVSLYTVTTRGVSAPSSRLLYSREQVPLSGPSLSVLVHKAKRILIQWEEVPIAQQGGFVTKYNIYFQTQESKNKELKETVSALGLRQVWLDCPKGTLVLHMTASNSAGEGPPGKQIYSQPAAPAVGLVIVFVFIITILIAIIANLMCWSCVRKRIKQKCISWGPAWLAVNLPKPGHSNAIRLLEHDRFEPLFSYTHSDPPLSPITVISQEERDEVYPTIHVEESQTGQLTVETPFLTSDTGKMLVESRLEHVGYKPQNDMTTSQHEEVTEPEKKQRDGPSNGEDDCCSSVFEGLLSGLLLSVDVNFSDSSRELTHSFVNDHLWPKTTETSTMSRDFQFLEESGETADAVETDSLSLDLQQDEIMTPDTAATSLSQCSGEMTSALIGEYFPQVAVFSTDKL